MDQKTLIGFILIGAILLFWPTYLDFISPEPQENDVISPVESVVQEVEKNIPTASHSPTQALSGISESVFTVETPLFTAGVSNKNGGSLNSFLVTKHLKVNENTLNLIDTENKNNLLVSYINQSGEEVFLDDFWAESNIPSVEENGSFVLSEENPTVTLSYILQVGSGAVQKDLTFSYNSYEVIINTNLRDIRGDVLDGNFRLDWFGGLPLTEPSQDGMFLEGLVGQGGDIESFRAGSTSFFGSSSGIIERSAKQYTGPADFAGYRTKYFGVFFVPQKTEFVELVKYSSGERAAVDIITNQNINFEETTLYFGPLQYGEVSRLGVGVEEKILGWQWLSSVSWLVYSIMIFMYGLIPNYGVVVVLFAILIKVVTYPLMAKQLRSSKKMLLPLRDMLPDVNFKS